MKTLHGARRSALLLLVTAAAVLAASRPAWAQISLEGEWVGRYQEDQMDRIPGGDWGDFTGLPINEAARFYGQSWDISRGSVPEHQCEVYNVAHIFRGPTQFRIWNEKDPDSQETIAIKMYLGTYEQWRTIWMDGRPHPPDFMPHTWMGFSTGEWHGDDLVVTTTHIKAEYLRREGIPFSDRVTEVEHFIRHGNIITHVIIATDPVYLTEPMINTEEFALMDRGNTNWLYNCETTEEIPRLLDHNVVPNYVPGANPHLTYFDDQVGLPQEAVEGGDETIYPEYRAKLRKMMAAEASK